MLTRRDFLKSLSAFVLSSLFSSAVPEKTLASSPRKPDRIPFLSVARGKDKAALVDAVLDPLGGMSAFVKKGDRVTIKPNAAWSRTPEQAANVHPEILKRIINMCYESGARDVRVVEHTCDNYRSAFKINGIREAVSETRASLHPLENKGDFVSVSVPKGIRLKKARIAKAIVDADVYINVPIAKTHGAATLTLSMKNHMGAVEDRWFFHMNDLHHCIADVSTVLQPDLTIVDATRIMTTNGPKGPGDVRVEDTLIAGNDQVALDAYATTLFDYTVDDVPYIRYAYEHGLGEIDMSKMTVKTVTV